MSNNALTCVESRSEAGRELASAEVAQAAPSFPDFVSFFRSYGVDANGATFREILSVYEASGFLYDRKSELLNPLIQAIQENWVKLLTGRQSVFLVGIESARRRSTGAMWRSSKATWFVQHLASIRNPHGTAALILGMVSYIWASSGNGFQVWFRTDNPLPMRIFAEIMPFSQGCHVARRRYHYYIGKRADLRAESEKTGVVIREYTGAGDFGNYAADLLDSAKGTAFSEIEDLHSDPFLKEIDKDFRVLGMRRYRRIFIAFSGMTPIGCAMAHRAPV